MFLNRAGGSSNGLLQSDEMEIGWCTKSLWSCEWNRTGQDSRESGGKQLFLKVLSFFLDGDRFGVFPFGMAP